LAVYDIKNKENIEEYGKTIQEYELNGIEKAKFNLVLREGKDGELKAFAPTAENSKY